MNIEILTQPSLANGEPFLLGEKITSLLASKRPKYKSVNFMFSLVKSNAIDVLKPFLQIFMENGGSVNFYVDSDKKFLMNPLVTELVNMGCNVYTYINSASTAEFQYRGIIFESAKTVEIFLTSGNLSLNGLYESHNVITHVSAQKEEYDELKNNILPSSLTDYFTKVSIETLPEILSQLKKASSIPTISDFTKSDLAQSPKIDLSEPNISIEIDDDVDFLMPEIITEKPVKKSAVSTENKSNVETHKSSNTNMIVEYSSDPIYYGADEAIDVENLLFEAHAPSMLKTSTKPIKTNAFSSDTMFEEDDRKNTVLEDDLEEEFITTVKTKDLSKTSIFMFNAPKITHKGICAGEIKVPTYIRDLISEFWGWPKSYEVVGGHAKIKSRICTFKIVDTMNPDSTLEDTKVKMFQRFDESSFTIHSSALESLNIEENDIIRLIKVSTESDCYYSCEVVRKEAKEYPIWEQFCTENFKNSSRKYGIM